LYIIKETSTSCVDKIAASKAVNNGFQNQHWV